MIVIPTAIVMIAGTLIARRIEDASASEGIGTMTRTRGRNERANPPTKKARKIPKTEQTTKNRRNQRRRNKRKRSQWYPFFHPRRG